MDASLIAPCGINCALCYAYQREKNHCSGCRSDNIPFDSCMRCVIKRCELRLQNGWNDCSPCEKPCTRLKQLNNRYREKYNTYLFENLADIRDKGMSAFLAKQTAQWTCPNCGRLLCMHHGKCLKCTP